MLHGCVKTFKRLFYSVCDFNGLNTLVFVRKKILTCRIQIKVFITIQIKGGKSPNILYIQFRF